MQAGLISTLTTVRNGEAFLAEAIDSLLAQTDSCFEVLVVDDGSTDRTREVLMGYADPRLRAAFLPPVGRVPALRHAVSLARGEFLAILDGDDIALPERLARQRTYLAAHPEVALVGARAVEFHGSSERLLTTPTGPAAVRRALGMYNPVPFSSVFCRRWAYEEVGGFHVADGWSYDLAFLIRVALRHPIDILPEVLVRYRRHAGQVSSSAAWEQEQRPRSARLQLWAARQLGLPPYLKLFPLLGWLYACLPPELRPAALKGPIKRSLLRLFRIHQ